MKTLFIPVKLKRKINKEKIKSFSKKLPKNIAIAYSIQFKEIAEQVKKVLSKKHKILIITQILGCSKINFSKQTQAILLISSGKFHAISLAFESKKPVYLLEYEKLIKISKEEIEIFEKRKKASYVNFLNSEEIGVLISTKPGQQRLKKALKLKIPNKKLYFFISNNINTNEFENFGLKSWINTACPRLDMFSNKIINIDKL